MKNQMIKTSPSIPEKFRGLSHQIESEFDGVYLESEDFPSGNISLGITLEGQFFVLEYSAKKGFGLSEIKDDVDGWMPGADRVFDKFDRAKDALLECLRNTNGSQNLPQQVAPKSPSFQKQVAGVLTHFIPSKTSNSQHGEVTP